MWREYCRNSQPDVKEPTGQANGEATERHLDIKIETSGVRRCLVLIIKLDCNVVKLPSIAAVPVPQFMH